MKGRAFKTLERRVATLEAMLLRVPKGGSPPVRLRRMVADHYGFFEQVLMVKRVGGKVLEARQVGMWLTKRLMPNETFYDVAALYGCSDHGSAMAASRAVQDRMDTEPSFKDEVHGLADKAAKELLPRGREVNL